TEYCNVGLYTYSGTSTNYVMDKAKTWANANFPGTCTLFIIDMATRQLAVWSSTDVQKTLTRSKGYTITDNVYQYASRGDYDGCAVSAFNQMNRVLKGLNVKGPMRVISNALLALLAAILLAYLFISARMEQEVKVSLPDVVTTTAAGAGAVIAAKTLTRKVKHSSSSGGGGFHGGGGGGFGGGGGGFGGGGGSHGF
ncbi:MAG: TPM domain-containing protein, partial [Clostridia bacterium]|nr:TPM domain-containing protein [Clostridia bacterium]